MPITHVRFVRRCRVLLCSFALDPALDAGGRDISWFREIEAGEVFAVGEYLRLSRKRTVLELPELDAFAEVRNRDFVPVRVESATMADTPCSV